MVKPEIVKGVVETYVFHHLTEEFHISRYFAFFHIIPQNIAEGPAEIFVPGVGKEAAGIGEHPDKTAQKAKTGQCLHLLFHSVFLVEEPPA